MDERVGTQDDGTRASSDTILSGLTSLENDSDTDEFGRLLIQRAKDEQRIRDALRGAGSRSGKRDLNLERQEDLERSRGRGDLAAQRESSNPVSVSSSERSDPLVRYPQGWGRKGRQRNTWMRRILQVDVQDEARAPGAEADALYSQRTADARDGSLANNGWSAAAADIPVSSTGGNRALAGRPAEASPSAGKRLNTSLDRVREWELSEDLTMGSVLASTPIIPKNRLLDEILQREIESIKEEVTARSQAIEITEVQEDEPSEHQPSPSSTRIPQHAQRDNPEAHPAQKDITLPKRRERGQSKPKSPLAIGDENQAPNSPIVVYKKSTETVGIINPGIQANAQATPQRPGHRRLDSQDLLRRLARATSASPSPKRTFEAATGDQASVRSQPATLSNSMQELPNIEEQKAPYEGDEERPNEESKDDPVPEANTTPEDNIPPEAELANEGDVRDTPRIDPPLLPEPDLTRINTELVPSPKKLAEVQTPKVSGAWVNTPAPETSKTRFFPQSSSSSSRSASPAKSKTAEPLPETERKRPTEENPEPQKATLPSSALEAVIGKAKSNHQSQGKEDMLGDSTIDSLEDLIHSSPDDTTNLQLDEDTLMGLRLPAGVPKTAAERDRYQEIQILQTMNTRLKAARTSIRDAGRGIKRVEHQVDVAEHHADVTEVNDVPAVAGQCKRCGCSAISARSSSLSGVWPACKKSVLCSMYCQPRYAHTMVGYGVNSDAPRLPFVTTTILFRPLAWLWRPILGVFQWLFESIYQALYQAVVEEESVSSFQTMAETMASYTTQVVKATMEADFSIKDDEFV
ncbi:hypothetical protein H2199_000564 [Coniosporium tulheliwenetii]|uniref:Uncharacterized protein n=1 Tax=Coniosporium tulheliwenetii TaxID=3383036 RepID=A0ACC2ZQD9_9PEZI|nr:hypothetical protein H2199_000564 [Cladosporium sp. JES 115]